MKCKLDSKVNLAKKFELNKPVKLVLTGTFHLLGNCLRKKALCVNVYLSFKNKWSYVFSYILSLTKLVLHSVYIFPLKSLTF